MPTLDWIGKAAVINHDQSVPTRLLHCEPQLSVGPADSPNLLVEGDNLVALKALLPFYGKSVKCIYIDPPYNTGNEGWIYNDNVRAPEIASWLAKVVGKDAEDLSRHDKWLCMMYPRLKLLKAFLRDDGAIFISIDDNEVAHLRLLLDEIFGARNFVANVIWQHSVQGKGYSGKISVHHNHLIIYGKSNFVPNDLNREEHHNRHYSNPDNDPNGFWRAGDVRNALYRPNLIYELKTPSGKLIAPPKNGWRWSRETMQSKIASGQIVFRDDETRITHKIYLDKQTGRVAESLLLADEVGTTREANEELKQIFGEAVFPTPKPTRLIQRILEIATQENDLVLDSFMGSGTTGHAALMLGRRFIGVEMEAAIARPVTRERLKRVIEGYGDKPALGGGFRFCTLGEPLFDETGQIRADVSFWDIAHHIFFSETGRPLPARLASDGPFIGACEGVSYFLLAQTPLDLAALKSLDSKGVKVVYARSCRVSGAKLERHNVLYKQLPYEVKTR